MRKTVLSNIIMVCSAVILLLFCVSLLVPFFWMVFTSFKNPIDYVLNVFGLPEQFEFENYASVFKLLKIRVVIEGGLVEYNILNMLFSGHRSTS